MPLLMCPNCQSGMEEVSRHGVQIDICPTCRSVWLDRGELEKLLGQVRRAEEEWEAEERRQRSRGEERDYRPRHGEHEYGHGHGYRRKRKKNPFSEVFEIFGGGD